jgi:hypothetical protein
MAPPAPSDPIIRWQYANLEEKQEPRRNIADAVDAIKKELASCNPNREEVSLGSLGKDHLVPGEIGSSSSEPGILRFQFVQALLLVALQSTVFGPPPVVCNFRHAYRSDRLRHRFSLRIQHVNLTEFRDDLFRFVCSAGNRFTGSIAYPAPIAAISMSF